MFERFSLGVQNVCFDLASYWYPDGTKELARNMKDWALPPEFITCAVAASKQKRSDWIDHVVRSCVVFLLTSPKVYNAMQKVNDAEYASPDDAANFLAKLGSEPGMFVERTFDDLGRLENVFWANVDQQEKMARFGDCIQMDTTAFTNRLVALRSAAKS